MAATNSWTVYQLPTTVSFYPGLHGFDSCPVRQYP